MKMFTLDDAGAKELLGEFYLGDTVTYTNKEGREYTMDEFIASFNDSYPLENGERVYLSDPKQYFDHLPDRFTGQIWVEK